MRLTRWTPTDKWFETFWNEDIRPNRVPALDVLNEKEHIEVRMDLPGVSADDVNIEIKEGILTISAQVKSDETRESGSYTYRERYTGSYQRSLRLPDTVDVQNAEAKFENGVLSLKMPKIPEAEPVRIPVRGVAVK